MLDTQQPAVLEVVRRRPAQRLLQLRRPPPGRRDRNKAAIICVPEPERRATPDASPTRSSTARVNEFAALLRDFCGLKTGDRVTLHMPMVPELPVAMLACARLGIIHSRGLRRVLRRRVRGPASPTPSSRVLVTMDGYYRNGELRRPQGQGRRGRGRGREARPGGRQGAGLAAPSRQYASADPDGRGPGLLRRRAHRQYRRARWSTRSRCPPRRRSSSCTPAAPRAGPRAASTRTGGYLAYVAGTSKYYQDIHPEDIYWCMADIGWITGHSYIVYGPLALGTTSVHLRGRAHLPRRRAGPGGSPSGSA